MQEEATATTPPLFWFTLQGPNLNLNWFKFLFWRWIREQTFIVKAPIYLKIYARGHCAVWTVQSFSIDAKQRKEISSPATKLPERTTALTTITAANKNVLPILKTFEYNGRFRYIRRCVRCLNAKCSGTSIARMTQWQRAKMNDISVTSWHLDKYRHFLIDTWWASVKSDQNIYSGTPLNTVTDEPK